MCAGRNEALSPANKRLDLTNPMPGASRRARSDLQVSRQTFGGIVATIRRSYGSGST
jgi:hypothetical protein